VRNFVIRLLVNALALWAAATVVSGITLSGGFGQILVVALIFGILNAVLKPILVLFSIPFLIVTLGLFALVLNGAMLLITARLTDHLSVSGLGAAILGSLVISLVTMLMGKTLEDDG
jgi:putative membrane protein